MPCLKFCSILCSNTGSSGFALTIYLSLFIFNSATKSPKILKNISKFKLIIVDLEKTNYLVICFKQLSSESFKSVAFFLGHPVAAIQ